MNSGGDDKVRVLTFGLVAAMTLAVANVGHAAPYRDGHCQIDVPADWVASKTRTARPDKKLWAGLIEGPSAAEIVTMELSLKAVKLSEDGKQIMLVSTASGSGMTNKQYHVITKTTPSCVADVTSPAGPEEALAKKIAQTVTVVR